MKKLYSVTSPPDASRMRLYIKTSPRNANLTSLQPGQQIDFLTYFNSFCVKKWQQYTTITQVTLQLNLTGHFRITFHALAPSGETQLFSEVTTDPVYRRCFSINELANRGSVFGFTLTCLSDGASFNGGQWLGEFTSWQEKRIGITICTYKREPYVLRTMQTLEEFMKTHPWLSVLVVDNAGTLKPTGTGKVKIITSSNFGGSGGFTRGMITYAEERSVDYVILMDDDIRLDTTALERSAALLCGLKEEFRDSFLAGAMLSLEQPAIQFENTAFWDKITYKSNFHNLDLSNKDNLAENGSIAHQKNQYAGWWFCCIPLHRIYEIGYPMPFFIKIDDIEYGVRNRRECITMNGISVWHETFQKKTSAMTDYFANRNSLSMNFYAEGCGFFTLLLSLITKAAKRIARFRAHDLHVLSLSVRDFYFGPEPFTKIPADVFAESIRTQATEPFRFLDIFRLCRYAGLSLFHYSRLKKNYLSFRENNLRTSAFWKTYLEDSDSNPDNKHIP